MKKAIFPGSFDPFHKGHKFVIDQALKDFDYIFLIISWNEKKENRTYNFYESKRIIKKELQGYKNIKILINRKKLIVEIAQKLKCFQLIRGIRNEKDKLYEQELKIQYQKNQPKIKIKYYYSPNELKQLSSSFIKSR